MMQRITIDEDVCGKAIAVFGENAQLMMAMEEAGEFISSLSHYQRRNDINGLVDEIADMYVMLTQVRMMVVRDDEIQRRIDFKTERLKERLLLGV